MGGWRIVIKVVFLGTNGWYDTDTGNTTCVLIETDDRYIVLDAGSGIYKLDRYIESFAGVLADDTPGVMDSVSGETTAPICKPIALFLSHFHLDHIAGFHTLNKFNFPQGISIYGQPGTIKNIEHIIDRPFTIPLKELCYPVEVHDLDEGEYVIPSFFLSTPTTPSPCTSSINKSVDHLHVESRFLNHSSSCMGYRFILDGKIITYCPDTGYCRNAVELARDADLLIAECSWKTGQRSSEWPHLNPEDAVKIAVEAGAKRLALTHFDANLYRTLEERREIRKLIGDNFSDLIIATDDLMIDLV